LDEEVSLNGTWLLKGMSPAEDPLEQGQEVPWPAAVECDESDWGLARVPGSVHLDVVADPYSRAAETVNTKCWYYRRHFEVPRHFRGRRVRLRFEATDYIAHVWLNGQALGSHEGYMDAYTFEVTERLHYEGDNVLVVRVWTPVTHYPHDRQRHIKGAYGAVNQKPDDITPMGITRPVALVASGPVVISDLAVVTNLCEDGSAEVEVEVVLDSIAHEALPLSLEGILRPLNFEGAAEPARSVKLVAGPGHTRARLCFEVLEPRLWWTWDHGRPSLYRLDLRLRVGEEISDTRSLPVGIREIEKRGWVFYLNRRRMFVRGTNVYYHLYLSEARQEDYERDLGLIRRMNVNMIRVHCHFENPEFYDLCDRMGILVWQDYLEARYDESREFALHAAQLYDPLIKAVRNHPCVAIWSTSDEESLVNYQVLTKHLEARPYFCDPQRRPVVRSTGRYGDSHLYNGWYGGSFWDYRHLKDPFISETGAQAIPNYASLSKFLGDAWPLKEHLEEWRFRRFQQEPAFRSWGDPEGWSLQDYIAHSQEYQARYTQVCLEAARRRKYQAGGILHFFAIDIWPSVTKSAIDFYRVPKKSYFVVCRSFSPVLASIDFDRYEWQQGQPVACGLWVVNDLWENFPQARLTWRILDDQGKVLLQKELVVDVPADSAQEVARVEWLPPGSGGYALTTLLTSAEGQVLSQNSYEFAVLANP